MKTVKNIRKRVALNLKSLMKQSGFHSQQKLAEATGVSQTQIGNVLRADKGASIDVIERLAKGFGFEPWILLSPVADHESFSNPELQLTVHCYVRLQPGDQVAIKAMIQQLYEATHTGEHIVVKSGAALPAASQVGA